MASRCGEINRNTKGTIMKIVEDKTKTVVIEFQDQHKYITETIYSNFKTGCVKNPYDKQICSIGYYGVGKYKTGSDIKHSVEYQNWTSMIRRCYDIRRGAMYSAYYDKCKVCDEWHNFQNFAQWYDENFYQVGAERMHIDKDILCKNNKIYSPETCLIVPQRINMIFLKKPNKYNLPSGVRPVANGMFSAEYNHEKIGVFKNAYVAGVAHDKAKKKHIIKIACEYKDVIPTAVYDALINWIPDYIEYASA